MKNLENRNNNYKVKIIVLSVAIFLLLILSIILSNIMKETENNVELSYDNLTNVKEVIEYYKSTYISEEESKEDNFNLDIYLKFCKLPYDENDNSNEKYYNSLINDVAKVIYYNNFKMIDKENNITVKVICNNGKVSSIIINDIEDYFIYMDSQISMKTYKEFKTTNFQITSEVLQRITDENWDNKDYFGTRDSIYNEYQIYFNSGIKVRTIQNKIYNIIFDKNYNGNVINNLFPGISLKSVESELGKPTFKDDENSIIGYKGEKIYVFFSENAISVYRIQNEDTDDFFKLADEYINSKIDLLEFMNQLTYMWKDYSEYEYTTTSVYLSYPLKGIEIKINYDDTDGILLYNNIRSNLSKVGRYLENTNFVARLQTDAVFEVECQRVNKTNTEKKRSDEYLETLDDKTKQIIGESLKYYCYPEIDSNECIYSMKFISIDKQAPNRELNDSIDSYLWISNDNFIYSKKGKGIYSYNLQNGIVTRIYEGKDDFIIKGYENGILYYDNTSLAI